jgi:hypothetical protein
MKSDIILFMTDLQKIREMKKHVDLVSLSVGEILSEVFIGEIVILEHAIRGKYLFIERVDLPGFVLNLRLRLSQMKTHGKRSERLTSQDQYYDLTITADKDRLCLCNQTHAQDESDTLTLNAVRFMKHLDRCASELYQHLLSFCPELSARKDSGTLESAFLPLKSLH